MKAALHEVQAWIAQARVTADAAFDGVSTDSRSVAAGNLFVALRGERFDAHDYLDDVAAKGAAAVLAERLPEGFALPALLVPDTRVALGQLAAGWRRQFVVPVIGVTGSNGKTTVKEMIASILVAACGADAVVATRGNLNNDIGVPLTVFRLDAACRAAVIELGMNHPGEIAHLTTIAQPTVALVNNAQREHQEFMASVEAVARENGSVLAGLPADGVAVFPGDDPYTDLWRGIAGQRKVITFGLDGTCDVTAGFTASAFGSDLSLRAQGREASVRLSAAGVHNVRNALAAAACALAAGIGLDAIVHGLEAFAPVAGRLQRKHAANGALVIDDTYNANPDSVRAAIDVLAQFPAPRLLVLGDMGEVGDEGPRFHAEIGAYAAERGIEHVLVHGELMQHAAAACGTGATHFADIDSLKRNAEALCTAGTTVLVKGSRFMRMERVVNHLVDPPAAINKTESH